MLSPWGDILAEAGTDPCVITADIDVGEVERVRARIPVLDHTRDFDVRVLPPHKLAALEAVE